MDPNYYAFATPVLLALTSLICLLVWSHHRRHRYLLWMATAQILACLGLSLQMSLTTTQIYRASPVTTVLYLGSISALAHALSLRLRQRVDWWLLGATNLLAMGGMWYFSLVEPNMTARLVVMSLYVCMVHGQVLLQLRPARYKHALDRMSVVLYGLLGSAMLLRIFLLLLQNPDVDTVWISRQIAWWFTTASVMVIFTSLTASLCASAFVDATQRLRRERNYDSLTGVLTRRAFEESVGPHPYERGLRALVFADLDHFKHINDQFGHAVGDQVLRHTGQVLLRHLRAADVVGRIGGEEFALALRDVDAAQAQQLVARVAEQLRTYQGASPHATPTVTASFGLVQLEPEDSLAHAMQRADRLLYQAKASGRNCIRSENQS